MGLKPMDEQFTTRPKLCPYCANSIEQDAATCPYCKADLSSSSVPKWLKRDEPRPEASTYLKPQKNSPVRSKPMWLGAILVAVALIAFFAGGYVQRSRLPLSSQVDVKQLQAKDQMIKSQAAELAQLRQQLNESSEQLAEMKAKLEQNQRALSAQQRLAGDTRKIDGSNANRSPAPTKSVARAPEAASSPPPPAPARRNAEPSVYETTRATSVYESPSSASRVVSQIGSGTRINVVGSTGDWLEVRSRRGNPPGYVRAADARLIGTAN
jgi:hypothetical protein